MDPLGACLMSECKTVVDKWVFLGPSMLCVELYLGIMCYFMFSNKLDEDRDLLNWDMKSQLGNGEE